jgi:hypothetical protein
VAEAEAEASAYSLGGIELLSRVDSNLGHGQILAQQLESVSVFRVSQNKVVLKPACGTPF